MAERRLVPLQAVPGAERAAVAAALAADLRARLERAFPDEQGYRRSDVVAPEGSEDEPRGLLELRAERGRGWGLRVRVDPAEDGKALRVLVDARPPWLVSAYTLVGVLAALAAAVVGAYGWWHGGRGAALMLGVPTMIGAAAAGLVLILPLRWYVGLSHRPDVQRVAGEVDEAIAALRAAHPAVGEPRRPASPTARMGGVTLAMAGLAAATAWVGTWPSVDTGWLCLLGPACAMFGCFALAFLVKFLMALFGLAEGGALIPEDQA